MTRKRIILIAIPGVLFVGLYCSFYVARVRTEDRSMVATRAAGLAIWGIPTRETAQIDLKPDLKETILQQTRKYGPVLDAKVRLNECNSMHNLIIIESTVKRKQGTFREFVRANAKSLEAYSLHAKLVSKP